MALYSGACPGCCIACSQYNYPTLTLVLSGLTNCPCSQTTEITTNLNGAYTLTNGGAGPTVDFSNLTTYPFNYNRYTSAHPPCSGTVSTHTDNLNIQIVCGSSPNNISISVGGFGGAIIFLYNGSILAPGAAYPNSNPACSGSGFYSCTGGTVTLSP